MTVDDLIRESHAMAVAKGWWDGDGPSVVSQVNNFHEEISEAWKEWRHGRMETWYSAGGTKLGPGDLEYIATHPEHPRAKPEGFWVEIANLCIRIADTMGAYGWEYRDCHCLLWASLPEFISHLARLVGNMTFRNRLTSDDSFWIDDSGRMASVVIGIVFATAEHHGIDLLAVIREKMAYNSTQPVRHGGLRA